METKDLIIIGGGPAGLTGGIYAGRAKLATLLLAGPSFGGQLMLTDTIDDFPGFPEGISGAELIAKMMNQVKKFEVEVKEKNAVETDFNSYPFIVKADDGNIYKARAIIIATGASHRWLGLPKEKELVGRGISFCAVCDGFFFKDKNVAVVGGGDSAMENALVLSKYAKKVTVIHRKETLNAAKILQDEALKNEKIEFLFNSQIIKIIGEERLEGVEIKNLENNENKTLFFSGLFISIGYKPQIDIFKNQLEITDSGFIKVFGMTQTSKAGIFAAGDVCDPVYKQAVTAAGFGAMAALDADRWLRQQKK